MLCLLYSSFDFGTETPASKSKKGGKKKKKDKDGKKKKKKDQGAENKHTLWPVI